MSTDPANYHPGHAPIVAANCCRHDAVRLPSLKFRNFYGYQNDGFW